MEYQIKKMNHRHQGILNWLITHPHEDLKACARFFRYTPQTIYHVVGSDMFQAVYRQRCRELGIVAIHGFAEKLQGLASMAMDKAMERIENGKASDRLLSDITKNTLTAMGYGEKKQEAPSLHIHVSPEAIEAARERVAQRLQGTTQAKAQLVEMPRALEGQVA